MEHNKGKGSIEADWGSKILLDLDYADDLVSYIKKLVKWNNY